MFHPENIATKLGFVVYIECVVDVFLFIDKLLNILTSDFSHQSEVKIQGIITHYYVVLVICRYLPG